MPKISGLANDGLRAAQALIYTSYSLIQSVAIFAQAQMKRLKYIRTSYHRTADEPWTLKRKRPQESRDLRTNLVTPGWEKSFLLSLPWEVRNMIWKEAAGGMMIHWFIRDKRLRGMRCRSNNANCLMRCGDWLEKSNQGPWPTIGVVGMLLSCRQIYSETINFVYAFNMFDTREPDVVSFLPDFLPSHHSQQIHFFNFHWTLTHCPSMTTPLRQSQLLSGFGEMSKMKEIDRYKRTWLGIWFVIYRMEQLMDLRVELDLSVGDAWTVEDLDIVRLITKPKKFRLVLPDIMARSVVGRIASSNLTVLSFMDEEY